MFDRFPLVSVLMLTYNQKDFVKEAVESVLAQDYTNYELIISDDSSTDGTFELLTSIERKSNGKVRLFRNNQNLGITRNSNVGLSKCSGEFVAMAYGDDIMLSCKLKVQVEWFQSRMNAVLCGHDVEVFSNATGKILYRTSCRTGTHYGADFVIRNGGLFPMNSVMFRRVDAPPEGFDERVPFCSDYIFVASLLARSGGCYGKAEGVLARYRRHATNASKSIERCSIDIETSLLILKDQFPRYADACDDALFRHVRYQRVVNDLADAKFKRVFRELGTLLLDNPFRLRLYFRLCQAPLIFLILKLAPKSRELLFPHKRL